MANEYFSLIFVFLFSFFQWNVIETEEKVIIRRENWRQFDFDFVVIIWTLVVISDCSQIFATQSCISLINLLFTTKKSELNSTSQKFTSQNKTNDILEKNRKIAIQRIDNYQKVSRRIKVLIDAQKRYLQRRLSEIVSVS
jgi:hypothetical protein